LKSSSTLLVNRDVGIRALHEMGGSRKVQRTSPLWRFASAVWLQRNEALPASKMASGREIGM
jgi:hypothetical protein